MRAYLTIKPTTEPAEQAGINIAMMPLRKNVQEPCDDWVLTTCPLCGRECWYQTENAELMKTIRPDTKFLCTECALSVAKSAVSGK